MRALAALLGLAAMLSAFALSESATIPDAATADFAPTKELFLSTDETSAELQIHNLSDQPLSFFRCDIAYNQGGSKYVVPPCVSETLNEAPSIVPSDGGISVPIGIPGCTVLSEPCFVVLSVRVKLRRLDGTYIEIFTPYHRYEVDANPETTFAFYNLTGNKPLFAAWGEVSSTLDVTEEVLVVHPASSEPLIAGVAGALGRVVASILDQAGFPVVGHGFCDGGAPCFFVADAPQHARQIASAIASVQSSLGTRVASIEKYFIFDDQSVLDGIRGKAEEAAKAPSTRLAETLDALPLQWWPFDSAAGIAVHDTTDYALKLRFAEAGPVDVKMRLVASYPGDGPTTFPIPIHIPRDAEYITDPGDDIQRMQIDATIEGDRPELFAVGSTEQRHALMSAYDPDALALDYARIHIARLAEALGVKEQLVSMVVIPSQDELHGDLSRRSVGLAMTFLPKVPMERRTMDQDVRPWDSPTPLAPMVLASPNSTVVANVGVATSASPDASRLDVMLDLRHDGPRPAAVRTFLRRLPRVTDVSIATWNMNSVRIDVVLDGISAADATRVVDAIAAVYRGNIRSMRDSVHGRFSDCGFLERRALAAAVGKAEADAQAEASSGHVRLKRLVLAVAYPLRADRAACTPFARTEYSVLANEPSSIRPLSVMEQVSLTYRTVLVTSPTQTER